MSMETLDVHVDILRARLPDPSLYYADSWHHRLVEKVWKRTWSITPARPPEEPGATPMTFLGGNIAEPLIWSRDSSRELRLLSNVCTHRSAIMLDAPSRTIRCPYHGRRFHRDGTVESAFGFPPGHPSFADCLRRYPHAEWGPMAFASLNPSMSFEEWFAPVRKRIDYLRPRLPREPSQTKRYERKASWLIYCENYLEGLHIPFVHPTLTRAIELGRYRTELHDWGSLQIAHALPGEPACTPPTGHPDAGERIAAWYFWLFPGTMINVYPGGLSINRLVPLGPQEMVVHFDTWPLVDASLDTGAATDLDGVEKEDADVVHRVARGIRTSGAIRGRYSPEHERGVHHFHRLLQAQLSLE